MNHSIRRMLTSLAVCAAVAGAPAAALAWAAGTHAYIARHTNKKAGLVTDAELCRRVLGANGPDLFNAIWTDEAQALAYVLHGRDPAANLAPWSAADTASEAALALGFASHNNGWGTDATSHFAGRTFGQEEGYVIAKAAILGELLAPTIGGALGLPPELALPLATEVSHTFVEFAVDFLLAEVDPALGATLYASASCYAGPLDDDLLVEALAPALAAALPYDPATAAAAAEGWIRTVQPQFVQGLGVNGWVLTLPYEVALPMIAHQTAVQAQDYLAWRGFPAPPVEQLRPLVEAGIAAAKGLCAPDFLAEIEATTGWVNGQMSSRALSP